IVAELSRSVNGAKNDAVTKGKRFGESVLKHAAAHRVRTRLEHSPQAASRPAEASGLNRGANGCGVGREVVYHQDAVNFAFHIHRTLYALEGSQRFVNGFPGNAAALCNDESSERVQHIVAASGRQANFGVGLVSRENLKIHAIAVDCRVFGSPIVSLFEAV